ncbi:MAG: Stp1/IreP family PP2C-type Ser/Thr phosphatase [Coprobacillaceae bacterium]
MNYYAKTDIGQVRSKNQDQAFVGANLKNQVLAVVCDGMGGHKAGEIASRLVMDHITGCFKSNPAFLNEEEVKAWIMETILQSNTIVQKMAKGNKDHEGMGTTVVLAILMEDILYVSHVGDSRAYTCDNEQIVQVTKDHTLVNALIDQGAINQEEAKHHSQKNVLLQAIGASEDVTPSFYSMDFKDKTLLLCSDGLYNAVDEDTILGILKEEMRVDEKVRTLIDCANKQGGHDNIAVSIIESGGM